MKELRKYNKLVDIGSDNLVNKTYIVNNHDEYKEVINRYIEKYGLVEVLVTNELNESLYKDILNVKRTLKDTFGNVKRNYAEHMRILNCLTNVYDALDYKSISSYKEFHFKEYKNYLDKYTTSFTNNVNYREILDPNNENNKNLSKESKLKLLLMLNFIIGNFDYNIYLKTYDTIKDVINPSLLLALFVNQINIDIKVNEEDKVILYKGTSEREKDIYEKLVEKFSISEERKVARNNNMKIEELINKLEEIRNEYGNIDIVYQDNDYYSGTIAYQKPELDILIGEFIDNKLIYKENIFSVVIGC